MDERERQIAAIAARARVVRPRSSRGLWLAGLAIGVVCFVAFVVILFADAGDASDAPAGVRGGRRGFGTGVAVGVVAGIAVGYAMARRKR